MAKQRKERGVEDAATEVRERLPQWCQTLLQLDRRGKRKSVDEK